jgi:hypothetical protein
VEITQQWVYNVGLVVVSARTNNKHHLKDDSTGASTKYIAGINSSASQFVFLKPMSVEEVYVLVPYGTPSLRSFQPREGLQRA